MGHFQRAAVACVMASLCLSVLAAENPKAKNKELKIDYSKALNVDKFVTPEMKADFLKFMQLRSALLVNVGEPCQFQSGGVCPIDIPVYLLAGSDGKVYCAAAFPESVTLPGADPGDPGKIIVWRLVTTFPIPPGATFTFYSEKDHGIIVLSDPDKQMKKGNLGDGTTPVDPTKYMFTHKHNKSKAVSVYLPIVLRTDNAGTSTEKVSVCGTPDPRIAND